MKRSINTTSAIREIRKKRPAFTLVELIVVITIVAVLATVGFLALSGYTKDAKDSTMKTNVRTVTQAVGLEAVTTDQSMRKFATFSGAYAMSGKVLGTVLSGGTLGTVGTNYTPGPVDFAALRMDASKLTADGTKYVMSAVDVPETLATGKTRTRSFFQVGAIDGTKTYVEGTLSPSSITGSETDVSGIIADPTAGSNTALASNVDSGPTVAVTCNPGENGSTGVCKDPYWANVISLLHFDGSITDGRPSNTWAMNGGVAFTGVAKWGTNSIALDGVDDYVDVATSTNWDFWTGDFTVEGWAYFQTVGLTFFVGQISSVGAGPWYLEYWSPGSVMRSYTNTSNQTAVGPCAGSAWHHFAYVRKNNVFTLYLDGIPSTTYSSAAAMSVSASKIAIGRAGEYASSYMKGYFDEFRVTKGYARYSGNFSSNLPIQAFAGQ